MKKGVLIRKLGITGGIGAGKTLVSQFVQDLGIPVITLDEVAKSIMNSDAQVRSEIIKMFGDESYSNDRLNTSYLAKAAFGEGKVERLNEIIHPRVYDFLDQEEARLIKSGTRYMAIESALMLKHGRPENYAVIVLVEAKKSLRFARVKSRNQWSDREIEARFESQTSFFSKAALLPDRDLIIENNATKQELKSKVERLVIHFKNVCDNLLQSHD